MEERGRGDLNAQCFHLWKLFFKHSWMLTLLFAWMLMIVFMHLWVCIDEISMKLPDDGEGRHTAATRASLLLCIVCNHSPFAPQRQTFDPFYFAVHFQLPPDLTGIRPPNRCEGVSQWMLMMPSETPNHIHGDRVRKNDRNESSFGEMRDLFKRRPLITSKSHKLVQEH